MFNRQNHISIKTKMKILGRMVLLAVSSLALAATGAQAATINTNIGDLILGFRVTDSTGQGATQDLEVDLGNVSQFQNATSTLTLNATTLGSAGLAVQDLINTYGANWATRTDLAWGLIATSGRVNPSAVTGYPPSTIWVDYGESATLFGASPTPIPNPNPPIAKRASGQNVASADYETMIVPGLATQKLLGATSTANSSNSAVINFTQTGDGSWTGQMNFTPNAQFGFFAGTPMDTLTNDVGTGTTSIADFYRLDPQPTVAGGPSVLVGQFSLNQNGTFTYTPVPEPSSVGLMGVGFLSLIGMVVLRRRRSVVA
jgi:hypothetical protein